jgi:hypothetical protein
MSDFLVESNRDQVLRYVWKGQHKRCTWAEKATGQFDLLDAVGQEARETKEIEDVLYSERERGRI